MEGYFESAQGHTLTQSEVWRVFQNHSQTLEDFQQFLDETGHRETYNAQAVLVWLGY